MKIITTALAVLLALTLSPAAPAHAKAPPLRDRVTVCRSSTDTIRLQALPCVYLAPLQGDRTGHSFIAYRDREHPHRIGLVRWLDDDRARFLFIAAVIRTEVQGTNAGPLYERVNICADADGGSASSLPCVWHSPTMANTPDASYVVRRSGRKTPVCDAEARRLLLVVAYRKERR